MRVWDIQNSCDVFLNGAYGKLNDWVNIYWAWNSCKYFYEFIKCQWTKEKNYKINIKVVDKNPVSMAT